MKPFAICTFLLTVIILLPLRAAEPPLACKTTPRFEDYPSSVLEAPPAPVDLSSHPKARRYRTRLREGAERDVDFAGAYTLVTWGCGTQCQTFALIDRRSGEVIFGSAGELIEEHRPASRLLIMRSRMIRANESNAGAQPKWSRYTHYLEWQEETKKFSLLCSDDPNALRYKSSLERDR